MSPCHGHNRQPAGWLQCSDAGCPSCFVCGYNIGAFSGGEEGNEGGKEVDSDEGSRCSCCKRFPQPAKVTTTIITITITTTINTMNTTNTITTINISPTSSSHQASSDGEHNLCPPLTILLVGGGPLASAVPSSSPSSLSAHTLATFTFLFLPPPLLSSSSSSNHR